VEARGIAGATLRPLFHDRIAHIRLEPLVAHRGPTFAAILRHPSGRMERRRHPGTLIAGTVDPLRIPNGLRFVHGHRAESSNNYSDRISGLVVSAIRTSWASLAEKGISRQLSGALRSAVVFSRSALDLRRLLSVVRQMANSPLCTPQTATPANRLARMSVEGCKDAACGLADQAGLQLRTQLDIRTHPRRTGARSAGEDPGVRSPAQLGQGGM
jgi:hypothetical protein